MSTMYADDLLHLPGRLRPLKPRTRAGRASPRPAAPARTRPLRYEDFEARSTRLEDLLGGHVFPRRF